MTVIDFETARHNMVENQVRCCKVLDPVLLNTLETMPREDFLPENIRSLAYMEGRVPLPCGQEMHSPLQEASILQCLDMRGDERVLEIGSGTGYLTTLLALHAKHVDSYEIHDTLASLARKNIKTHGITNANVITANAMQAECLKGNYRYDVIVLGASLREIPGYILGKLKNGGRLIAFIGCNPVVSLICMQCAGRAWKQTKVCETLLLGMEGLPEKREFVF